MSVDATGSGSGGGYRAPASKTDDRAVAFAELTEIYREMADVYDELADVYRARAEGKSAAEVNGEIQETLTALGEANAAAGKATEAFGSTPPAALNNVAHVLADIQVTVARLLSGDAGGDTELAKLHVSDREMTDQEHIDLFERVAQDAGNSGIGDLIEAIFSSSRYAGLKAFLKEGDNLDVTKLLLTTPGLLQKAMAWEPDGWGSGSVALDDPSTRKAFIDWVVEERGALMATSAETTDDD